MGRQYITAMEFNGFSKNQDKLINILNHNMTKLGNDVSWLKTIMTWQTGIISAIAISVVIGIVKLAVL